MSQLKDLTVMMMYLYIFAAALNERNIIAISFTVFLSIIFLEHKYKKEHQEKTLKNNLYSLREYFISSLNHDLRIPTIAQIRAIELVRSERIGKLNNNQKEMLYQVEDSCKCILNLMSLLINTFSIENNKIKFIYEKFNISEIINDCFKELMPMALKKHITFEYKNENKYLDIVADKEELKKAIMNILAALINNAYTGDIVSINLCAINKKIRLTITGNKKGFMRTMNESSNYTSIGQCIKIGFSRKVIETLKGEIIENKNGNSFTFELPQFA